MAILEKRRAVNQLPRFQRYQDTRAGDRSAALRGETPITSAIRQLAGSSGYGPMGESQGFNPMGGGMGGAGGAGPTGGAGKGTVDKFGNMAGQPKTAVTSALKGSTAAGKTTGATAGKVAGTTAAGTTSKMPSLTSKTAGTTGKTLTSTGTGAAKTTGVIPKTTGTTGAKTTGSNVGSKLTSALAGAALGAGTKLAIDKLTGAKTTTPVTKTTTPVTKTTTPTTKTTDTVTKTTTPVTKTTTPTTKTTTPVTKTTTPTTTTKTTTPVTKTTTPTTKTITPTTKTTTPKSPITSTTKSPVTPKTSTPKTTAPATKGAAGAVAAKTAADIKAENPELTDEEVQAELDRVAAESDDYSTVPEGAIDNGDGTYSETVDGMVTTYDADGNIIGMEAAEDGTTGDDTSEGGDGVDTTTGDEDTTTETLEDGTVVTLDANGDVVSYTDAEGVTYNADGDVIDGSDTLATGDETTGGLTRGLGGGNTTTDGEETAEELFSDDEGNLYDADGNLVEYADGTLVGDEESTEGEVAYTDEYGNTYDESGELIAEGDHSDYVQYDEDGNSYDWDGNLIEYAEGYDAGDEYSAEDEYSADDEYSSDDEYAYEGDDIDYDVKKGGLIYMQEGGDTEGEEEDGEPVSEEENEDGTITQYFDDGSSITYDADGEVVEVTEATEDEEAPAFATRGITVGANGQQYENPLTASEYQDDSRLTGADPTRLQSFLDDIPRTSAVTSGDITTRPNPEGWPEGFEGNGDGTATYVDLQDGSTITIDADGNILFVTDASGEVVAQDGEPVTTGGLGQANPNIEYFDDGSYRETYGDGSSVIYDPNGNPFSSTDTEGNTEIAKTTTVDDDGNRLITDYYGNVVQMLDPNGNVIPLGGDRATGPTQVTGAGGSGGTDITKNPTIQQRLADENLDKGTKSAIDSLLAGLNTYGGAGAAGAVLGALLSDTDLFGGGTGSTGGNFDMTGVGSIDPRTTDFGIGPARYVGYDEYGTPEQMPELYGQELYQNLNAPGFNEVNAGDYARYDAQDSGLDQFIEGDAQDQEMADEGQGMAAGGQPQGGLGQTSPQTYYTFGTPVDPLQNLRNPAPFQQQPQQPQMQSDMPPQAQQNAQQMPPQQVMPQQPMPQGMPPAGAGMKSGGLPAWSNVPITQGRLNFRQGAAVHGAGDGQSDDIPAMLADGEYVIDAETVAQIGNGSTKAGAQALDKFRENIRMHKRSAPINKIPPKTKALTSYLKGAR